jgi:hemerythrin-like domain-containing protein
MRPEPTRREWPKKRISKLIAATAAAHASEEVSTIDASMKPAARFMAELRLDHADYSRVLSLLSREVSHLAHSPRRRLPLIREAFKFVVDYLDRYHHPREDVLYESLARRSKRHGRVLVKLRREHCRKARVSQHIYDAIQELSSTAEPRKLANVAAALDRFVAQSRDHIDREERIMYSGAARVLSSRDWLAIEAAAPQYNRLCSLRQADESNYPLLASYFRSSAPYRVAGDGTQLVEHLRLDKAGAAYGNLVGRAVETVFLAFRQNHEALELAFESMRMLCTPRPPLAYADAIRMVYRSDVNAVSRWTDEWRYHFLLGRSP